MQEGTKVNAFLTVENLDKNDNPLLILHRFTPIGGILSRRHMLSFKKGITMSNVLFRPASKDDDRLSALRALLADLKSPFSRGDDVGIKLHWGEAGNRSFLNPTYAREIVQWLQKMEARPFVFDTTVLYSGGRRTGSDALKTAADHGYTHDYLTCPVVIADGMDGRAVMDIPAGYKHFRTVQVTSLVEKTQGFIILSHFKGHLAAGIGGAIKNLSMGFASRAQKQRMHADVRPKLKKEKCTRCGVCVEVCPAGAAAYGDDGFPAYDPEKCIGCAQCISFCPELALKILWGADINDFQEKLVETAAAVWQRIAGKTLVVNAAIDVTIECDCFPGDNPIIAEDAGFFGGYHPVVVDAESLARSGRKHFEDAHPQVPLGRQFDYAREIGFWE
jgi:uncharacterized protein